MKLISLNKIFEIEYGNQLDFNKMILASSHNYINFVSRSSQNLGIVARVEKIKSIEPYSSGLITVALGGAILSSFIQPAPFYTAQNIKVLKPKVELTFNQKLFYCQCISLNKFKYSTFGREANKSLDTLLLPDISEIPSWVNQNYKEKAISDKPVIFKNLELNVKTWKWFQYSELFNIERGRGGRVNKITESGTTPLITAIEGNNGLAGFIDAEPTHQGGVISVPRNGNGVAEAFYQNVPFCSTEDVHIFKPKFNINIYIAIFLITIIRMEKYRYSFGRKWSIERMNDSFIKLPVDQNKLPDWKYMENYIKSLQYSCNF